MYFRSRLAKDILRYVQIWTAAALSAFAVIVLLLRTAPNLTALLAAVYMTVRTENTIRFSQ